MERKKYIICAPLYSGSAGVRALYMLRSVLEEKGFDAKIFCLSENPQNDLSVFTNKITNDNRKNDIVVYPETVSGNPLLFRNVVRYVLNYPGHLGGDKKYHDGELVFSWSETYLKDVPLLRFDMIDRSLFYEDKTIKDTNACFVHKGASYQELSEVADAVKITMDYPETRSELADLLRRTKNFYTFDDNTSLGEEAALCGCRIYAFTSGGFKEVNVNSTFDNEKFLKQIDAFISLTQEMNYAGKINKSGHVPILKKIFARAVIFLLRLFYCLTGVKAIKNKMKQIKKRFLWQGGERNIV